jgi:subtilisin family serine protease
MLSQRDGNPAQPALAVKDKFGPALLATALAAAALAASVLTAPPSMADSVRDAQQWVLDDVRAPQAWATSQGRGITVAVLDSGVDPAVSDLAGSVLTGPDYTQTGTPASSPHWGEHGTWMASLIAGHGHGNGSAGILGVAPRAKILSVRVITDRDDPGYQHYQHETPDTIQDALASAIRYAVRHHAAVISMSIGYSEPSAAVRSALQYASDNGAVVVASSGNSGDSWFARTHSYAPYSFPADYPGVLAVGAADRNGTRAGFSSDNLSVQVAAPGVDVPAQGRDGQYWEVSGTSPACALAAGAVALIKASYPDLPPVLVGEAIVSTTRDRPPKGYDERVGFGTVDASAALARAKVISEDVPTAGYPAQGGQTVTPASHFGGGPSRAAPPPVRPRGIWPLAGFGLLGLASLALVVASATRIMAARRPDRGAAAFGPAEAWANGDAAAAPASSAAPGPGYPPAPLSAPPVPPPADRPPAPSTSAPAPPSTPAPAAPAAPAPAPSPMPPGPPPGRTPPDATGPPHHPGPAPPPPTRQSGPDAVPPSSLTEPW